MDWYSDIEEPIRDIVRVLRENGVNTTCSCGHEMYVEADVIPNGQLFSIHKILFNYLTENDLPTKYSIDIHFEQDNPLTRCFAIIKLTKPQGE